MSKIQKYTGTSLIDILRDRDFLSVVLEFENELSDEQMAIVKERLTENGKLVSSKVDAIKHVLTAQESQLEMLKAEKKRIADAQRVAQANIDKMKHMLLHLRRSEQVGDKVEGKQNYMRFIKNKKPTVEIHGKKDSWNQWSPEHIEKYVDEVVKVEYVPNRQKLAEAAAAGEDIPASVKIQDSYQIRWYVQKDAKVDRKQLEG